MKADPSLPTTPESEMECHLALLGVPRPMTLDEHLGPAGSVFVMEPVPLSGVARLYMTHLSHVGDVGGMHAHKTLSQIVIAVGGRIRMELRTPAAQRVHMLQPMKEALSLGPGIWREYAALDANSTLLVVASDAYREEDYIRDWQEYCDWFEGRAE